MVAALNGRPISWLASTLNVALSTAHSYKKGAMPPADVALKICKALDMGLEWYINGVEEEILPAIPVVSRGILQVPLLDHQFKEVGSVGYAADLVNGLGVDGDTVRCMIQKGSSMRPTMPEGSEVLFIPVSGEPEDGEVYILKIAGRLMLRRVMLAMNGQWKAVCDNPAFRLEEKEGIDPSSFVGRVVWVSHRV